jgi:hypothetical protein
VAQEKLAECVRITLNMPPEQLGIGRSRISGLPGCGLALCAW